MDALKSDAVLHDAKRRRTDAGHWTLSRVELAAWLVLLGGLLLWTYGARRPYTEGIGNVQPGIRLSDPEGNPVAAASARLDLNRASAAELELLPGIGPALARRIVQRREEKGPYLSPWDLASIQGLSRTQVERLLPLVETGDSPPPVP